MVNWADPSKPPDRIPNVPILLTNLTKYDLRCEAQLQLSDGVPTSIRVLVNEIGPNPLAKELEETKMVLGDLLQEKLTGLKIYVVSRADEPLWFVHTSAKAACDAVDRRGDTKYDWIALNDGHGLYWRAGEYIVIEHEVG